MSHHSTSSRALPNGTKLPHNYIIDTVVGEGGFGITYSGHMECTDEHVAIKEYFPSEIAYRLNNSGNSNTILPYTGSDEDFQKGCEHFRQEASILREFQHLPSIVSIKDVIESNGTIYLVMEYIDGITLKQYIKENGIINYEELLSLMTPLIQSLIQIHKKGLLHRDISPENIMVGTDNQFHLIDFGAASFENSHITKTITVILKSGYAPPEQYLSDGKQGAWTDIYALAATMYYALTGVAPMESIRRIQSDDLPDLASLAPIQSWQAAAILKGMNLSAANRYQNLETFYQALRIPPIELASVHATYLANSIEENKTVMKRSNDKSLKAYLPLIRRNTLVISILVLLFILAIMGNGYKKPSSYTKDDAVETMKITTEQPTTKHKPITASGNTASNDNVHTKEITTEVSTEATTTRMSTETVSTNAQNQSSSIPAEEPVSPEQNTETTTENEPLEVIPDDRDTEEDYDVIHLK